MRFFLWTLLVVLARGDECGVPMFVPPVSLEVFRNQERSLAASLSRCLASEEASGGAESGGAVEAVRWSRSLLECPRRWSVTCLDHFNCDWILRDATEPLHAALVEIFGAEDVAFMLASDCERDRADCFGRMHLVVNANFMDETWSALLPKSIILVNLEQLVIVSREVATEATQRALTDPSAAVVDQARAILADTFRKEVLGVTVDDYREFVAIHPAAARYPWIDYSYRNVQVAGKAGMPCVFVKPIGSTGEASARIARVDLEVIVSRPSTDDGDDDDPSKKNPEEEMNESLQRLSFEFLSDDSDEEVFERAKAFVEVNALTSGAGCLGSADCVVESISHAARRLKKNPTHDMHTSPPPLLLDAVHLGGLDVERRMRVVSDLDARASIRARVVDGAFGAQRDDLLGATALGLNVHRHDQRRIVEVLRLLAYARAGLPAISEATDQGDKLLEDELRSCVLFVPYDSIAPCAANLLQNLPLRATMRRNAHRIAALRSETNFLKKTLSALFPHCALLTTTK